MKRHAREASLREFPHGNNESPLTAH